jgi:hypothetical protein
MEAKGVEKAGFEKPSFWQFRALLQRLIEDGYAPSEKATSESRMRRADRVSVNAVRKAECAEAFAPCQPA